jgi:hypothetical protein
MSRLLVRANKLVQDKHVEQRVSSLERLSAQAPLKDINTSSLSSAQIDAAVFSNGITSSVNAQAGDGLLITDSTNSLLLVRQGGKWYKTAALTLIP